MKEKTEKLTEEFNKLAQKIYAQTEQPQGEPEEGTKETDDDVVDAEFEEVKEDEEDK
jgi:molecular chaperone DnaK